MVKITARTRALESGDRARVSGPEVSGEVVGVVTPSAHTHGEAGGVETVVLATPHGSATLTIHGSSHGTLTLLSTPTIDNDAMGPGSSNAVL